MGTESATHHHVSVVKRGQKDGDLRGFVLTVGVELVSPVVALVDDVPEAEAQSTTDSQVERQGKTGGAAISGHAGRSVRRPVVNDHHVMVGDLVTERGQHSW
jgi:hypothetical protein